ncbi:MAG: hypothetical protein VW500_05580 [Aquiluna sp.]
MRKFTFLALVASALWWGSLLSTWVIAEGKELTGVELSQTLVLLPALCLITLAISLYGKLPRTLLLLASLTALAGVGVALVIDWQEITAVQAILQETSGLIGATGNVTNTIGAGLFALLGLVSAALAAFAITRPPSNSSAVDAPEPGDSRSLWDEQR